MALLGSSFPVGHSDTRKGPPKGGMLVDTEAREAPALLSTEEGFGRVRRVCSAPAILNVTEDPRGSWAF